MNDPEFEVVWERRVRPNLDELSKAWAEKGRYGFENISSWFNGLLADFEGFIHGYYQAYVLEENKQDE